VRVASTIKVCGFALLLGLSTVALLRLAEAEHYSAARHITSLPVVFLALAAIWTGASLAPVSFHSRGETYLVNLMETPLLLGLVFAPPAITVLACLTADVAVLGLIRRQSPAKLLFNLALGACGVAIAVVTYHAILGHAKPVSPLGLAAGFAALAAASVTENVAVPLVARLNGQQVHRASGLETLTLTMFVVASTGLAFVVLNAAWWDWWAVVPLVLVAALIVVAYRGYLRLSQRFSALQRLYDFSHSLATRELEPAGAAAVIVERLREVLHARSAELLVLGQSGGIDRASLRDGDLSFGRVKSLDGPSLVADVLESGKPILKVSNPLFRGQSGNFSDPLLGQFRDAVLTPLMQGERAVGALVALDRDEALNPFDDDDLRLFEALAANAISSLERARLVEELRLEAEAKIHQATYDSLTGLPNRTLLLSRVAEVLAETGRAAVAILDLDRFKDVNDTLGHETGDRLLCEVARRLKRAARQRVTVARLGGDEFAVLVPGIIGPEEAVGIVRDLEKSISDVMDIDGMSLAIRASAGIALAPDHGDNVAALLQRADIAMYVAKERKSGIELYSPASDQNTQRRLTLGGQLLHALDDCEQLSVVFQPMADLTTGEIRSVEALVRWDHPSYGPVDPSEFVRIAEQTGLIGRLTDFVLAESFAHAADWVRAGLDVGLSFNLSGRELSDSEVVARIVGHLKRNGLPAERITLEVTETEVMSDLDSASDVLNELSDLGLRVAVDDYGTGYSSLAYLHKLPVNELKIDRSFVEHLGQSTSNRIIVRSSVAMAHSLGLSVVAEGAEDELTCAILADSGCDAVQGYFLSEPKTAEDLVQWLRSGAHLDYARDLPALRRLSLFPNVQNL
jgi:diguanylate cyclase (GGDEF)-like protein